MRYLKTFEHHFEHHNEDIPKVGDYVIINVDSMGFSNDSEIRNFFSENNVGKIDSINSTELRTGGYPYYVKFDKDVPNSVLGPSNDMVAFRENEFLYYASTLEELEVKKNANKYNL